MLLLDRIIRGSGIIQPIFGKPTNLINCLKEAEVVKLDNVANFFYRENPKEEWWPARDFPNLICPWPVVWYEFLVPREANSEGKLIRIIDEEMRYGALFMTLRLSRSEALEGFPSPEFPRELAEKTRWQSWVFTYKWRQSDPQRVQWSPATAIFLEEDGRLICGPGSAPFWEYSKMEAPEGLREGFLSSLNPFFLGISFCHCANVKLLTNKAPEKLRKKQIERRGTPNVTFKTLEIQPMKTILRTEGDLEKTGLRRAMHICRGHFKDYRDHGLFGKHHGLFWWDMRLVGHSTEGVSVKDYSISPR